MGTTRRVGNVRFAGELKVYVLAGVGCLCQIQKETWSSSGCYLSPARLKGCKKPHRPTSVRILDHRKRIAQAWPAVPNKL